MKRNKQKTIIKSALNICLVSIFFFGVKYLWNSYSLSTKRLYLHDDIVLSSSLRQELKEAYKTHKTLDNFPISKNSLLGSRNIKRVASDTKGRIKIEYADSILKDAYLILVPEVNDANELVWQCGESNIDRNMLPDACQERI